MAAIVDRKIIKKMGPSQARVSGMIHARLKTPRRYVAGVHFSQI
jgi:hypothetical protein